MGKVAVFPPSLANFHGHYIQSPPHQAWFPSPAPPSPHQQLRLSPLTQNLCRNPARSSAVLPASSSWKEHRRGRNEREA